MKKIALYTRLSPNPKKDDIVTQERDLREYASKQDWSIVAHYTDLLVSGSTKGQDRPQFKKMMQDASKRKFDLVLFWSLDRLSREGAYQTLQYLNELNHYGVDYKSYTEQYLDSCGVFKDAVISIMAVIAKQERIRIIERTVAGLETARLKGKRLGRPKATIVSKSRNIAIDINMAKSLRLDGHTLKQIADKFSASEATISRLLRKI